MYQISQYSNRIKNVTTGEIFPYSDSEPLFSGFQLWCENNTPEYLECFPEEAQEISIKRAEELESQRYTQRRIDGGLMYDKISGKFRVAKLAGIITESEHAIKEEACIPIRNEILAGQWISGLNKLVDLGAIIIGQALYDELYTIISSYILNSYTTEEINRISSPLKK